MAVSGKIFDMQVGKKAELLIDTGSGVELFVDPRVPEKLIYLLPGVGYLGKPPEDIIGFVGGLKSVREARVHEDPEYGTVVKCQLHGSKSSFKKAVRAEYDSPGYSPSYWSMRGGELSGYSEYAIRQGLNIGDVVSVDQAGIHHVDFDPEFRKCYVDSEWYNKRGFYDMDLLMINCVLPNDKTVIYHVGSGDDETVNFDVVGDVDLIACGSRRGVLESFLEATRDVNMFIGQNSDGFDWPRLLETAKREGVYFGLGPCPEPQDKENKNRGTNLRTPGGGTGNYYTARGIQTIDLLTSTRLPMSIKMPSYRQSDTYTYITGQDSFILDGARIWKFWEDDRDTLYEYSARDSSDLKTIDEYFGVSKGSIKSAKRYGMGISWFSRTTPPKFLEKMYQVYCYSIDRIPENLRLTKARKKQAEKSFQEIFPKVRIPGFHRELNVRKSGLVLGETIVNNTFYSSRSRQFVDSVTDVVRDIMGQKDTIFEQNFAENVISDSYLLFSHDKKLFNELMQMAAINSNSLAHDYESDIKFYDGSYVLFDRNSNLEKALGRSEPVVSDLFVSNKGITWLQNGIPITYGHSMRGRGRPIYFERTKREIVDLMFAGREMDAVILASDRLAALVYGDPTPRQAAYRGTTNKAAWEYKGRTKKDKMIRDEKMPEGTEWLGLYDIEGNLVRIDNIEDLDKLGIEDLADPEVMIEKFADFIIHVLPTRYKMKDLRSWAQGEPVTLTLDMF